MDWNMHTPCWSILCDFFYVNSSISRQKILKLCWPMLWMCIFDRPSKFGSTFTLFHVKHISRGITKTLALITRTFSSHSPALRWISRPVTLVLWNIFCFTALNALILLGAFVSLPFSPFHCLMPMPYLNFVQPEFHLNVDKGRQKMLSHSANLFGFLFGCACSCTSLLFFVMWRRLYLAMWKRQLQKNTPKRAANMARK